MKTPLFSSLAGYRRTFIRGDALAGLTVWAILVPEALAYASIAGVSPVIGLYAAPPALVLYAVLGSSRHLVAGPMSATAALSAAAVASVATDGNFAALTATLALVTGLIALVAGLLRLGFVANFISEPVLKGFIVGLALTIIGGQLPKLFGVGGTSGNFFRALWSFLGELGDTSGWTLLVGSLSLALILLLHRYAPLVPGSLVAALGGILAVKVFDLDAHGVAIVGPVASGLPTFGLPDVDADRYLELAPAAVGIMLVAFAEGLAAAKVYATRDRYSIDVDRELVALGATNLGSGLSSGMVVGGSLSKTAVNAEAGARTQLAGLVAAALVVLTLLFFTNLFQSLPEATLAAIVIAALIRLVDVRSVLQLYRLTTPRLAAAYGIASRPDFFAGVTALLGVLVLDVLPGLFVGIAVSLLLLVYRASRPSLSELRRVPGRDDVYADHARHPEAVAVPGIAVLRVDGELFFANAAAVRARIEAAADDPAIDAVVLDLESVPLIDVTAGRELMELGTDLAHGGVYLAIARRVDPAGLELVRSGAGEEAARRVYPTVSEAVRACEARRHAVPDEAVPATS